MKGHTVMFHKHIEDICNELPRKKVNMVCVVKEYTTTKTSEVKHQKFLIRRNKVLKALHWLKQHHPGYKNVTIVESNLDWMKGSSEMHLNSESISVLQKVEKEIDKKETADSVTV